MIDAGPSLRAVERLNLSQFAPYLAAKGWTHRPAKVDGIAVFTKAVAGIDKPILFILPTEPGEPDEVWRKADALRTLAGVEGRDVQDVAREIARGGDFEPVIAVAGGFADGD
jgi:hypothetical protein